MNSKDWIESLLQLKYAEEDFSDCFTVEIVHSPKGNKIEVYIDADNGLAFDRCQKISRYLEAIFDEDLRFTESYLLEVSSPGISRPLKFIRQYRKNIDRILTVDTLSGKQSEGILTKVEDDHIVLQYETKRKEGKKNIKEIVDETIPFDQIKQAIVNISF